MYGSSGKLGRGGGRGGGGGKRNIHSSFHPSKMNRPSSASGRPSTAGAGAAPRNRSVSALVPASSAPSTFDATEETYSLVTSNPLNFAMTIRLAPNLVEEIKRVEAQGGVARIKFDGNINNPVGNIISVGGKDFRFKWSPETGDLCDIYEERRSGDDGNGLLVESGSVWRKLNVQRVLDESTKNHVKLRTEEASRKLKSRKAIVLDHGNPSTKSQIKALAAAESNPWRNFQPKKEQPPSKKRKVEPVSGPPKPLHKSGLTETPPSKARAPTSPPSSPPEHLGAPASPFGSGNTTKGHADMTNISSQDMNRTIDYDKHTGGRVVNSSFQEKIGSKGSESNQPSDLQTVLISLLMDNSLQGMSLKALEKAAEDAIPNSARQIEPILKKIATFQAPGRYFLKPGVEIDSFNRPLSERQSYPEGSLHPLPENGKKFDPPDASDLTLPVKTDQCEDQKIQFRSESEEAPDFHEKLDALHADLFGDKKESDNNEGPAVSSSDSGSDSGSDTDSSDSGSDSGSHSRSKSRSLAGSRSGSSSGSESDASTNNKEVSDEDVDIMTSDDDQEKHQLQASRSVLPKSPVVSRAMDGEPGLIEIAERQDVHSMFEIEKDSPMPEHVNELAAFSDSLPKSRGGDHVEEVGPLSRYQPEHQERQDYSQKVDSERDLSYKDGFNLELSETSEKVSRGKNKKALDKKKFESKSDLNKMLKAGNISPQHVSGSRRATSVESHQNPSDRPSEGIHWSSSSLTENSMPRDENVGINSQNDYDKVISGNSISDTQHLGSANSGGRAKTSATRERSGKHSENLGRYVKHPDKSLRTTQGFTPQKVKFNGETKEDPCLTSYTGSAKSSKDGFQDKHVPSVDSYQRSVLSSQTGNLLKDDEANTLNKSAGNGRTPVLQRELSDLELGELREPLPEVTPGYSSQAERKNTSKQAENKSFGLDALNSNTGKRKPTSKLTAGPVNPAPINSDVLSSGIQEGMQKRVTPQHHAEDIPRSHQRAPQAIRPHRPRGDQMDIVTQSNRGTETGSRGRLEDAERSADTAPEVLGKPHGRLPANAPKEHGVQEGTLPPRKESRKPKPNILPDLNNKQKDASLTESNDSSQRKRESSSDESSCPYSKYEKEEPQLKGTIRDFSGYSEYVKEYQEKYDIYVSLNRVLESSREEFLKYQREIETSVRKDRERYSKLVRKIKESFGQSAERHKRLKKIFFVLHEELANLKKRIKEFAAPYLKNL